MTAKSNANHQGSIAANSTKSSKVLLRRRPALLTPFSLKNELLMFLSGNFSRFRMQRSCDGFNQSLSKLPADSKFHGRRQRQ
jgi:hypothetical protein